jgi:hypothetical protein
VGRKPAFYLVLGHCLPNCGSFTRKSGVTALNVRSTVSLLPQCI